jgi:predicted DNA binding protein
MLEVRFRFRHDCWVSQLSRKFPDVRMSQWCNAKVEVLEIEGSAAPPPGFREGVEKLGKLVSPAGNSSMVLLSCRCRPGKRVDGMIEDAGCLYLSPTTYLGGWEHYRVIAFDEKGLRAMFRALAEHGEVALESKRSLEGDLVSRAYRVSTHELVSALTGKQAQALLAAIESGYYKVPRKVRFEDIARRRNVPRTTFEEHVRKAESKVISAMAPYVAMQAHKGA